MDLLAQLASGTLGVRWSPTGLVAETVMGHLLVPTREGMVEFRAIAKAGVTGMRETTLLGQALNASPAEGPAEVMARLGTRFYDDPAHDAQFPDHPLTRVRSALRWLTTESGLAVSAPAVTEPLDETVLAEAGFAVTPPPRYLATGAGPEGTIARFGRVSFSGTDGVQSLTVVRDAEADIATSSGGAALETYAREQAEQAVPRDAADFAFESLVVEDEGRIARGATTFVQHGERKQNVWYWRVDQRGGVVCAAIAASQCVPRDELRADLDGAMSSLRLVTGRGEQPGE